MLRQTAPTTPLDPIEDFTNQYNALCEKTGLSIHYRIEHTISPDGSFKANEYIVTAFVAPK